MGDIARQKTRRGYGGAPKGHVTSRDGLLHASHMNVRRLAKLSPPHLFDVAPRQRLFERLDRQLAHPAVWLHGVAGAGKTTLVASYADEQRCKAHWLHVDAADRDPAIFFHYLSLLAAAPDAATPLPAYGPEHAAHLAVFARRLLRELFLHLADGSLLILDNVHTAIDSAAFREILHAAVEEAPPHCHLLIVSRDAPPPEWARLLASRRLGKMGGRDLLLTSEEVGAIAGLDPDRAAEAEVLRAGCGGWAAGLTLILAHGEDAPSPLAAISVGERAMFDFLATEVFDRARPQLQDFLLRVWPLPRITAQAAQLLTGEAAAAALLDDLYRRNLFTESFFEPMPSYRLHGLFRSFLCAQAKRRLDATEFGALLRAAALQLEQEGELTAAAELLADADDADALAALLLRAAPGLLASARTATLRDWLERLPAATVAASSALSYWLGMARLTHSPATARAALEDAYALCDATSHPLLAAQAVAGVINSVFAEWSDFTPLDPWLARLEALLPAALPEADAGEAVALSSAALVGALYRRPDHAALPQLAADVLVRLEGRLQPDQRVTAATFVLNYCNWVGDLARARTIMALVAAEIDDPQVSAFHRAWYWLRCAYHHYLACDSDALAQALARARDIAECEGFSVVDTIALLYEAFGHLSAGRLTAAAAALEALEGRIEPSRSLDRAIGIYLAGWLHLARGEHANALARAAEAVRLAERAGVGNVAIYFGLLEALASSRGGDAEGGWRRHQALQASAPLERYPMLAFEVSMVGAHLAATSGRMDAAIDLTCRAAEVGARHDFCNTLLWIPDLATEFACRALAVGAETEYIAHLIERRGLIPAPASPPEWPWPLRLRCFGGFTVERHGEVLSFQRKAQKRPLMLLMALVAAGGRGVSSASLAERLWPDADGDAARGALATTVFRLRHLLGEHDVLEQREGKLSLDPQRVFVDVWYFEQLVDLIADGKPGDPRPLARRLLDCYAGPFLAQEDDAAWILPARERLRTAFLRAVERLGAAMERAGAVDEAAQLYARGVEADPLAESLYRSHMLVLRQLGRRAEALEVYRRCRHMLSVLLGIEPAAETEALRRQLD